MYRLILLIILAAATAEAPALTFDFDSIAAKGPVPKFFVGAYRWVDRTFNGTDTAYVRSTGYKWNVKVRSSNWSDFNSFYFDRNHEMNMHSPFCSSIGADIQFMAVALGYDINLSRLTGGKDRSKSKFNFEFSSGLVSGRIYSINNTDGMTITSFGDLKNLDTPYKGINSTIWGIEAICVINPRRYSNSAAFSFGKIQLRSQGSWLVGLAFQSQKLDFDFSSLPDDIHQWLPEKWQGMRYATDGINIGVSGGYGYNWVPRRNWTIGVQAIIIPSLNYGYVNTDRKQYSFRMNHRLNLGAVWNHDRWFIGVTAKLDASLIYYYSTLVNGLTNIEAKAGWRFNLF
ncbi:MAG: DUF4421 domain-containing protein [Paramuribaculum sp.]|nr:DUF4421 domain-containing protein [Paramuribaculum sp.]MDE5921792.1 DUF4421 domain-containing protein [Paramuribaculum sp.]